MIPFWFKFIIFTLIFVTIILFIKRLIDDMKVCEKCKKRMYFWQEVYFKTKKVPSFTSYIEIYVPYAHSNCKEKI